MIFFYIMRLADLGNPAVYKFGSWEYGDWTIAICQALLYQQFLDPQNSSGR